MGLYNLLVNPPINTGFKYYTGFLNDSAPGNSFSTPTTFGQRTAPYPTNSNQPYVRIPIPPINSQETAIVNDFIATGTNLAGQQVGGSGNQIGEITLTPNENSLTILNKIRYNSQSWGPDFLTRGNLFGLVRTADDIERLSKYFFDFTRPNGSISGLFFSLKQNLLSLSGQDGVYLPTSTLLQASISLFGFHVQKQGLVAGLQDAFASLNKTDDSSGIKDFRKISENTGSIGDAERIFGTVNTYSSLSPSYLSDVSGSGNIEIRTNFQNGGRRGNITDYTKGKLDILTGNPIGAIDKINALNIYNSVNPKLDETTSDLINFRISIIDNQSIGDLELSKFHLHFRAYLDSFGDSYDASWKSIEYVGRAEPFYRYSGFKRSLNVDFTLAASSKQELIPMYKKLNFLASSLAPSYSQNGYMMGNLVQVTVGDYLHEQVGFIDLLSISIPENSPYEINLGLDGKPIADMRQLPMILTVKMKFTPIHQFRPEIATIEDPLQRYIALENSENGVDNTYKNIVVEENKSPASTPQQTDTILQTDAIDPSTSALDLVSQNRNNNFVSNNSIVSNN
jgi:hypothetical protein